MKRITKLLFVVGLFAFSQSLTAANSGWTNILDVGGNNEGELCTEAIQNAIDKAAEEGGGTLYFPAGDYLTGAIHMKSNTTLHLDAGAVLRFSTNFDHYLPFVQMRWEGTVMNNFSPLIYAYEAENITITGRGKIDGQGKDWWMEMYRIHEADPETLKESKYQKMWTEANVGLETTPNYQKTMRLKFFRPPLIQPFRCKNVRIEGVTIVNSPFWTVNPAFCDNVTITGVTIENPPSPNTDGINPTSCRNVHISDCHISVGDDCITIKSGRDIDGRKWDTPTENVTITNCTMLSGHGGVVIGSEVSGSIRKVTISNCVFDGTDRGIRLKAARGRGGVVEEIRVDNVVMKDIQLEAIVMNLFYDKNTKEGPVTEETPIFRNIHISNVTGSEVNVAGKILGIPEMPIDQISFSNINMQAKEGISIHTATNVELHDVQITTEKGPSVSVTETKGILLDNIKSRRPHANRPVIEMTNVSNALVTNNFPMVSTPNFLKIVGEKSMDIFIQNNQWNNVEEPVIKGNEVKGVSGQ
ncbi:glycoside hydrolase family 28 protein [Echinicola strongylocentroti]|uniref:Glycoside hydrolase family 28 protein n=1 Tax=Echinicola strongylocentroti TaxID=1795355 RepID=A0A2Z4II30_9BACT|nr:glycoside hydrolase family 28 protein [Echinicola strongylocentroti]AWW30575.1 glycoside hydrolase family 28 protein [Echinicola strongylocentroti]